MSRKKKSIFISEINNVIFQYIEYKKSLSLLMLAWTLTLSIIINVFLIVFLISYFCCFLLQLSNYHPTINNTQHELEINKPQKDSNSHLRSEGAALPIMPQRPLVTKSIIFNECLI